MTVEIDYYSVLRLKPASSSQDVRRQYRRLAKVYHPDRNPGEEEWCAEQLAQVNAAYEFLSDQKRKAAYDRSLDSRKTSGHATQGLERYRGGRDGRGTSHSAPQQTYVASSISVRRVLVLILGTFACIFLGAMLTVLVYGMTHPGGLTRLNLPTLTLPARNTNALQIPTPGEFSSRKSENHRRFRHIHRAGPESVAEEQVRLERLGVQVPSNGFTASELRHMADRVQRYDESH